MEAREVGQRQDLAAHHVDHHHAAGLGLVHRHGIAHALVGEELHLGVERQLHLATRRGVDRIDVVVDHASDTVAHDAALAVTALEVFLERQLHAFAPLLPLVGEAHHVRRRFALGVVARVAWRGPQALDAERTRLPPLRIGHLALDQNVGQVLCQTLVELDRRHAQQAQQVLLLRRRCFEVLAVRIHRAGGHAGGQDQPVAVDDAAAARRHVVGVDETAFALREVEVRGHDLHVHRTTEQQQEAQRHHHHQHAAAPRRRLGGQQRTAGVGQAARADSALAATVQAHHLATTPDAALSTTKCVTAGFTVRIASFSRATFSTRRCVAWAWRSASSRLYSACRRAPFVVRAIGLVEQTARLVRRLHQRQTAEDQRQQQHEVHPRHVAPLALRAVPRRGNSPFGRPGGLMLAPRCARPRAGSPNALAG